MNRSEKKKQISRIVCFLILVCGILILLTNIMKPNRLEHPYDVTRKIKGFYAEPKNSLDIVFVGSSQLFSTVVPVVLWQEQGITSYVFGANEQTFSISYYYVKEALKYQHPKAIVLEVSYCSIDEMPREGVARLNFDDMKWGEAKVEGIMSNVDSKERESFFWELEKYHSRWDEMTWNDFMIYNEQNPYKGWTPFEKSQLVEKFYSEEVATEVLSCTETKAIDPKVLSWLKKIKSECERNNVELLLLKTPNIGNVMKHEDGTMGTFDELPYYNEMKNIAQKENLEFLNMNFVMGGTYHNDYGNAKKATSYIGRWLTEKYAFSKERQAEVTEEWIKATNEVYQTFDWELE